MTDNQHNPLLDAVDLLTLDRKIHTTITDDDTGEWLKVHTEIHPPLLTMLVDGASSQGGSKSSDPGIPIDAEAIELLRQIHDIVRLWVKQTGSTGIIWWPHDLHKAIRVWYIGHAKLLRDGKVSEETDQDVTRMVQGWVRMIQNKFDQPEKREWKEHCPAWRSDISEDGEQTWKRCDARRVTVDKVERFAITLNITAWTAECCICNTTWTTKTALSDLRYESNVWALDKVEREAERWAEMARLANGDTPEKTIIEIAS